MFGEIKQYKTLGFNKSQIERTLNINYKTVKKYWDMTPDEYTKVANQSKSRYKKIDIYKDDILEWITDFRDMSAAQVLDWIKERHGEVEFKERSLRLYISNLRQEYNLRRLLQ